jgi:hypothetical protein
MAVIPAHGSLRQKDHKFEARYCLKKTEGKNKQLPTFKQQLKQVK